MTETGALHAGAPLSVSEVKDSPSKRDLVRIRRSKNVRGWVAPIVKEILKGFTGTPVGYLTKIQGLPRAQVRTASYVRSVPVSFTKGEDFGDEQYEQVFFCTFLLRHRNLRSYDLDKAFERLGFGTNATRVTVWWESVIRSMIEEETDGKARLMCQVVFEAARGAWNDPVEAERVRRENRIRNRFRFENEVKKALAAGFTRGELGAMVDMAVVKEVMES